MYKKNLMLLVLLMIGLWSVNLQAVVVKKMRFQSVPSGAEVSLLQGTRRVYLGTTPFEYDFEFHSEISILRMEFKKAGYESKTIEVNPKQERLDVNLISQSISVNPDTITDPTLRNLQQQLGPMINRTLPELLTSKGPYEFQLGRPVRVTKLQDKVFLVLSIELGKLKEQPSSNAQDKDEIFLKMVWNQFGQNIVIPLGKILRSESTLNGILLDVGYSHTRHGFEVGTRTETNTVWECVPGMVTKQVYDPCIRRRLVTNRRYISPGHYELESREECESGTRTVQEYNPCATKAPVTRFEVMADPKSSYKEVQSRAQYFFTLDLMNVVGEQEKLYSRLGILFINDNGEAVIKRGFVPLP